MNPTLSEWLAFVEAHPHDFTIQYPPRREYFMQNFRRTPTPNVHDFLSASEEVFLYLHIPFCEARCSYCNFAVDVSHDEGKHRRYVDALLTELESHADWLQSRRVMGVDIGGGTPTRLAATELARITRAVRPFVNHETHPFPISIETTPRIAAEQPEKLETLRAGGIDRVSLGVQSFNAATLASVNRRYQIEKVSRAVANLRQTGFTRVNLDVIFGLPEQSLDIWKRDLEQIVALEPDSITTYDCLYRGAGRAFTKGSALMKPPEVFGDMYNLAYQLLTSAGWVGPYGSTNFCRYQEETGTSAYFEGRLLDGKPFLGLGNYATSMRGNFWSFNVQGVAEYVARVTAKENPSEFFYELPPSEMQAKYVLWSLNYGFVDESRFKQRFDASFSECFSEELEHAVNVGWLQKQRNYWCVNEGQFGRLHAIRSLFYTAPARRWLMSAFS